MRRWGVLGSKAWTAVIFRTTLPASQSNLAGRYGYRREDATSTGRHHPGGDGDRYGGGRAGTPRSPWHTLAIQSSLGAAQAAQVDFNGDDFDDLAIGVPNEDVGGQVNAGAVNILYGSASGLTATNQLLTQASAEDGDQFGASVAKGDFNNDSFTDLAVGAPGETLAGDVGAGAVNVFYGSASGLATTSQVLVAGQPRGR